MADTKKFLTVLIDEKVHKKLKLKLISKGLTISEWLRKKVKEEINPQPRIEEEAKPQV